MKHYFEREDFSPSAREGLEGAVRSSELASPSAAAQIRPVDRPAGVSTSPLTPAPSLWFFLGRLRGQRPGNSTLESHAPPRSSSQPAAGEQACAGRCMGMHTKEMPCLETIRVRRRERVFALLRRREEQAMEAVAIGYQRLEQDLVELRDLRGCHEGVKQALADIGTTHAALIRAGVPVPVELFTAQSELAGVGASLCSLLGYDVRENADHKRTVRVLRDGEGVDGA